MGWGRGRLGCARHPSFPAAVMGKFIQVGINLLVLNPVLVLALFRPIPVSRIYNPHSPFVKSETAQRQSSYFAAMPTRSRSRSESRDVADPDHEQLISAPENGRAKRPTSTRSRESYETQILEASDLSSQSVNATPRSVASSSHTREGRQGGPGLAARPPSTRSLIRRISSMVRKNKKGIERQKDELHTAQQEAEQTKKENAMLKQQLEDANKTLARLESNLIEQGYALQDAVEECQTLQSHLENSIYVPLLGEPEGCPRLASEVYKSKKYKRRTWG
ncbi:hypothetical protein GGTG_08025 [Gaeumannomyces tritici R3-111a-1]|uniref:Uncharacterized protein n=1 Tax=Gaeumannomyces tritici (strain R3-111a-1) TaxID=644352 RepID=J3P3D8_GAET3|nr:hypothetical protein GGTG_08025 [Gaeumannomyces tritici R3-111a-1]EJT74180.1 hypothetical protein GGTG_08025 [Gaeumannomyces tritici R3-111a-1]